jgi:hypothetical protein
MSAVTRAVHRSCPRCRLPVVYVYDGDGSSVPYDGAGARVRLVEGQARTLEGEALRRHNCADARDRHVGGRPLQQK